MTPTQCSIALAESLSEQGATDLYDSLAQARTPLDLLGGAFGMARLAGAACIACARADVPPQQVCFYGVRPLSKPVLEDMACEMAQAALAARSQRVELRAPPIAPRIVCAWDAPTSPPLQMPQGKIRDWCVWAGDLPRAIVRAISDPMQAPRWDDLEQTAREVGLHLAVLAATEHGSDSLCASQDGADRPDADTMPLLLDGSYGLQVTAIEDTGQAEAFPSWEGPSEPGALAPSRPEQILQMLQTECARALSRLPEISLMLLQVRCDPSQDWIATRAQSVLALGVRKHDHVADLGDGLFAVLMPSTNARNALIAADRLSRQLQSATGSGGPEVRTDIGISSWDRSRIELGQLLWEARHALEQAGQNCRGSSFIYV